MPFSMGGRNLDGFGKMPWDARCACSFPEVGGAAALVHEFDRSLRHMDVKDMVAIDNMLGNFDPDGRGKEPFCRAEAFDIPFEDSMG